MLDDSLTGAGLLLPHRCRVGGMDGTAGDLLHRGHHLGHRRCQLDQFVLLRLHSLIRLLRCLRGDRGDLVQNSGRVGEPSDDRIELRFLHTQR